MRLRNGNSPEFMAGISESVSCWKGDVLTQNPTWWILIMELDRITGSCQNLMAYQSCSLSACQFFAHMWTELELWQNCGIWVFDIRVNSNIRVHTGTYSRSNSSQNTLLRIRLDMPCNVDESLVQHWPAGQDPILITDLMSRVLPLCRLLNCQITQAWRNQHVRLPLYAAASVQPMENPALLFQSTSSYIQV